jgi:putative transposase
MPRPCRRRRRRRAEAIPVSVELPKLAKLSVGQATALAVTSDGTVIGWCDSFYGQLGHVPEDGRLVYHLKRTFSDGASQVTFTPKTLLRRLVPLIPRPRVHLVRYHGIFSPRCRAPRATAAASAADPRHKHAAPEASSPAPSEPSRDDHAFPEVPLRPRRLPWAQLLRRVHRVDVHTCPDCRGSLRILAFLTDPDVTAAILICLGLHATGTHGGTSKTPPTKAPAQQNRAVVKV